MNIDSIADRLSKKSYNDIIKVFKKVDELNYDSVLTEMAFRLFAEELISLSDAFDKGDFLSKNTIDLIKKLNEIVQE